MKKTMAILLAALMLLGTAACGTKTASEPETTQPAAETSAEAPAETNDKPYDGTTLNVVSTNSAPLRMAQQYIDEFYAETGITVNFEIYDPADVIEKVSINAASKGDSIDVFTYRPLQEALTFEANGWFSPLNDYIAASGDDYDYEDFFASGRDATTASDGSIYGIPYLVEGIIIYVNTKIWDTLGFDHYPTTMDELMEQAAAAYDPANNVYGIAMRGEGNAAVTVFASYLYAFGGDFMNYDTLTATMDTPEAQAAVEYYADLLQYGPDGITSASLTDSKTYFQQGITLFRVDAYSQNPTTTDPEQSLVWDCCDYAMFPAGTAGVTPTNTTAWAWAISAFSKNQDASWEFIKWASSKEQDVRSALDGGFTARSSTWADDEAMKDIPAKLAEVVSETAEVGFMYDRPVCKDTAEVRAIVGEMIDAANTGMRGEELSAFMKAKNAEIQAILDAEK